MSNKEMKQMADKICEVIFPEGCLNADDTNNRSVNRLGFVTLCVHSKEDREPVRMFTEDEQLVFEWRNIVPLDFDDQDGLAGYLIGVMTVVAPLMTVNYYSRADREIAFAVAD